MNEEDIEPAEIVDLTIRRRPQSQSRFEDFHYKEAGVLETVISTATPGDAQSVHAAIENVGLKEVWLKVAGGEKACVIDNIISRHRPKLVLEFGTYVGYTSTRMALQLAQWGGKVVTMEMDPVNATIARNHIELAGLSHAVTVQLGHSDDAVQIVLDTYGERSVDMVFMDQRGTAFHDDLQQLERLGILSEPAVVVADNVLKPGAPYHVWRIGSMPHYRTDIIDLREFGSAPVEDWMTVSWVSRGEGYGCPAVERRELTALARESDRFRLRAMATSMKDLVGDPLDEFAGRFTAEFVRLGICSTLYVQTEVESSGGAVSRLVRLRPGEAPPKWDGDDPRERILGGTWRSEIAEGAIFCGEDQSLSSSAQGGQLLRREERERIVIGISGVTRSGKGWVSKGLLQAIGATGKKATTVVQEDFWFQACQVNVRGQTRTSEEEPECTNHEKFAAAIKESSNTYDVVIAEGNQLLYNQQIVAMLDHIFLIELGREEARRCRTQPRDATLNPNPLKLEDFDDLLWPAHERYMKDKVAPLGARVVQLQSPANTAQRDELVHRIMQAAGLMKQEDPRCEKRITGFIR